MEHIEIKDIHEKTILDLFSPCNTCVYWEAPSHCGTEEALTLKRQWFEKTWDTFGNCGKLLYADSHPVGYSQYCPPHFLENAAEYETPASPDAILISCLYITEGHRKRGLGTALLLAVLQDIKERGYTAVETYSRDDSPNNCSGPTAFYTKNGFTAVSQRKWEAALFSLVRRDLFDFPT